MSIIITCNNNQQIIASVDQGIHIFWENTKYQAFSLVPYDVLPFSKCIVKYTHMFCVSI